MPGRPSFYTELYNPQCGNPSNRRCCCCISLMTFIVSVIIANDNMALTSCTRSARRQVKVKLGHPRWKPAVNFVYMSLDTFIPPLPASFSFFLSSLFTLPSFLPFPPPRPPPINQQLDGAAEVGRVLRGHLPAYFMGSAGCRAALPAALLVASIVLASWLVPARPGKY